MAKTPPRAQEAPAPESARDDAVQPGNDDRALATIPADMVKSSAFNEADLRDVDSFDQAIALVQNTLGSVDVASDVLGDGFALLDTKNKAQLVGVPCVFAEWTFNDGDFGTFVSARVIARTEVGGVRKLIINDGSTGIAETLAKYTKDTGKTGGLLAPRGLRVSEYEYVDPQTGERKPAKTYYIDTSA